MHEDYYLQTVSVSFFFFYYLICTLQFVQLDSSVSVDETFTMHSAEGILADMLRSDSLETIFLFFGKRIRITCHV